MNTKLRKQLHVPMIRERAEEVSRCQVSFVTSETRWIHFSVAYLQLMKFIKNVVSSFGGKGFSHEHCNRNMKLFGSYWEYWMIMNNHGMLLVWRTKAMLLLVFVTLLAAQKVLKVGSSFTDCFSMASTAQQLQVLSEIKIMVRSWLFSSINFTP